MKSFQSEIEEKKIVVVSSEIFFKIPFKDDGVEFLKKLTAKFGQVKVIIYIRRQDEWIESRHRHSVLSGSELTLEKLSKPFFSDYSRWINYWANIFGSDNIVLRLFARDKLKKSSLCVDFLNILGVSTADNLPFKELRRNESIGNLELEFMKIHLNLMLGTPINYNLGNVLLAGVGDKTYTRNRVPLLSAKERLSILENYAACNDYLAKKYFNSYPLFNNYIAPSKYLEWKGLAEVDRTVAENFLSILKKTTYLHRMILKWSELESEFLKKCN